MVNVPLKTPGRKCPIAPSNPLRLSYQLVSQLFTGSEVSVRVEQREKHLPARYCLYRRDGDGKFYCENLGHAAWSLTYQCVPSFVMNFRPPVFLSLKQATNIMQ